MNIYYSPSKNKLYAKDFIYINLSTKKLLDFILMQDNKVIYNPPKDLVYIGEI